ncbi:Uncharacterised protein [Mycobacteroides abscessus subsp. abscessus]|nr:Uncharacterised protein [Mycobacteroides abscessus subsp. abscessus]
MPLIRPSITFHEGLSEPSGFLNMDVSAPSIHSSG